MARTKKSEVKESTTEEVVEEKKLTPTEYFNKLKGTVKEVDLEELKTLYENGCKMMKKYQITGQVAGAEKLYNFITLCDKEIRVYNGGFTKYVNRFDLDEYISNIADKAVIIVELRNYERDIPDDIVDIIADANEKELFDDMYVVFTDYTGSERSNIEESKRAKDPILFGALKIANQLSSRLYYIADWEDEFCDLTLDKLVKEFKDSGKESPVKDIIKEYPTIDSLRDSFKNYK